MAILCLFLCISEFACVLHVIFSVFVFAPGTLTSSYRANCPAFTLCEMQTGWVVGTMMKGWINIGDSGVPNCYEHQLVTIHNGSTAAKSRFPHQSVITDKASWMKVKHL